MNLILFNQEEDLKFLPTNDERAWHIINILKATQGQQLDCGIKNGKIGKLTIDRITGDGIYFTIKLTRESNELYPISLIIGAPRPPVAKRLLKDLTSAGVSKIIFTATDLGEKTYLTSKLWRDDLYKKYIDDGLIQSETTKEPAVKKQFSLLKAIESIGGSCDKLLLDHIDPQFKISQYKPNNREVVIAIGGERGFTNRETSMLKEAGFSSFSMGNRILRTETISHQIVGTILSIKGLI